MSTTAFWRNGRLYYSDKGRYGAIWPANPEMWSYDDFEGADGTDISARTTGWLGSLPGTNDALIIESTAGYNGIAEIKSGDTDDDHAFLVAPEFQWYGAREACFEACLYIETQVTAVGMMMGFSETTGIANAGPITLSGTTWTTTAVDGAMFVYDTDATTDTIRCMAVNTNVDAASPIDTSVLPVAGTMQVFRVELEDDGTTTDARFFIDGKCYGVIEGALTRTALLKPFVCCGTRTGAANRYVHVDYVNAWQNRS